MIGYLSTKLPGQEYGGSYPIGLAQSKDGKFIYAACASLDAVAVFDMEELTHGAPLLPDGFIPTEWYPTALTVHNGELLITTGKGTGTGPNNMTSRLRPKDPRRTYIGTLLHGSLARVNIAEAQANLSELTNQVIESNLLRGNGDKINFAAGGNPIHHVIYIIKENRTFDQILARIRRRCFLLPSRSAPSFMSL